MYNEKYTFIYDRNIYILLYIVLYNDKYIFIYTGMFVNYITINKYCYYTGPCIIINTYSRIT